MTGTTAGMRRFLPILLSLAALGVGACGDNDNDGGGGGNGGGAAPSQELAGKSAEEILSESAAALRGVRSYRVDARQTDADGPGRIVGDFSVGGDSRLRFQQAGQRFEVLTVDGATYMKADDTFWKEQVGANGDQAAKLLAGKWVKAPSGGLGLEEAFDALSPKTLATCLADEHGKITKKGTGEVDGQETVVLHDDGKNPGGTPGDLHVAATGKPLPLRMVQTGPRSPGKSKNPKCSDGDSATKESDVRLSNFDEPVDLEAPKDALDLGSMDPQQQGPAEEEVS